MPYQLRQHEDYLEVRLEGLVESAFVLADLAPTARHILVDYAGVTDVRADSYQIAEQARRAEQLGLKVAVYAPRPAWFGLNRQALLLGLVKEGVSISVFSSLEEAEAWLRAG